MRIVFDAANSLQAHMIKGVLDIYGIKAFVQGEHLQSAAGELPISGCVNVSVENDDYIKSREIIKDWEANKLVPEEWDAD